MDSKIFRLFLIIFIVDLSLVFAQNSSININPTPAEERLRSIEHRHEMRENSIFGNYPVRSVGPVVMSGRITDLAVDERNPRIFFVAFASGGLYKTVNSGNTMEPVFDHQGTLTIGDIAISRADNNVIWVGTGENNSSRSSYSGTGMYKSTDGGKNWIFVGLPGSQHIGRIVTHPTDPGIAWVASLGPLYSMNDERGIFKTKDGGKNWRRTLTPADSTGVIDLVIDPDDPDKLWAATWQRFRQAWNFKESGEGSAIYRSEDGGESWVKSMRGFPTGKYVGRIGLDISKSSPNIIYAFLDNQETTKTEKESREDQLEQADFLEMSESDFLKLENDKLNSYLRRNGFPEKYSAQLVKNEIKEGIYEPRALAEYLGDANQALFDTDVKGAEVYRSEDGGKSWKLANNSPLEGVNYTYGYYFGQIRVSPDDPEVVYIMGVPALKSIDGGQTWKPIAENQPVHVDHHAMWINPNDTQHVLLGNDGGLYESHDGGENFIHHNVAAAGQFYTVAVDMEKPYNIYGGLQDNGVFKGPSTDRPDDSRYWERIFGGDGMHVAIDPRTSNRIYTGFQFGNYFRIDRDENNTERITPKHDIGDIRYRFNWNTPLNMSHHNPDIIYIGSQKLHRSMDRGETWTELSDDLTNNLKNGDVPYSTITTIAESPLNFNLIWIGTDDGNVQITRDGGTTWKLVSKNLPEWRWVSEVHASSHDEATAYVSMNGYRFDEFKTYIYKTEDYGMSWTSVKGNLPDDVANVIIQDPEVPEILYAGLDHGSYISFNDGNNWHLVNGVPNAASYDMVIHPRDLELVIGTHGRSIYAMDVTPLHTVYGRQNEPIVAIEPDKIRFSEQWGSQRAPYYDIFEPEVEWLYWIGDRKSTNQDITIQVLNTDDTVVKEFSTTGEYGFNRIKWNLALHEINVDESEREYLNKGTYTLILHAGDHKDETKFTIE